MILHPSLIMCLLQIQI